MLMALRRSFVPVLALGLSALVPLACSAAETSGSERGSGSSGAGAAGSASSSATQSASSAEASASASSAEAATTATTTGASSSAASTGSGPSCDDSGPNEPNDSELGAHWLGNLDDCDGTGGMVAGIIASDADADWYEYTGDDSVCSVDPTRVLTANVPLRLCKYAECLSGTTTVTCPLGTTDDTSPDGRAGCCATEGFSMAIECSTFDDNAEIFIRVDSAGQADCTVYSLDYHF